MAVKSKLTTVKETMDYTVDAAAEAGYIVLQGTQSTGNATGSAWNANVVVGTVGTGVPASGSIPVGVLTHPVVASRDYRKYSKVETFVGEVANLLQIGTIETNAILGTPTAGAPAYVTTGCKFATVQANSIPAVGKFVTAKDTEGYATVEVRL